MKNYSQNNWNSKRSCVQFVIDLVYWAWLGPLADTVGLDTGLERVARSGWFLLGAFPAGLGLVWASFSWVESMGPAVPYLRTSVPNWVMWGIMDWAKWVIKILFCSVTVAIYFDIYFRSIGTINFRFLVFSLDRAVDKVDPDPIWSIKSINLTVCSCINKPSKILATSSFIFDGSIIIWLPLLIVPIWFHWPSNERA